MPLPVIVALRQCQTVSRRCTGQGAEPTEPAIRLVGTEGR